MKLVKSLLLGSAAGLAVVSTAAAADLPSKKAAPVEYVRVCSAQGVGFFYIPGTETCLRISGRVRADYQYVERDTRLIGATRGAFAGGSTTGFRARGIINADARTQTGYGTLRAFVRFQMDGDRGTFFSDADAGTGNTDSYLDKAFIQWAGITAGRAQSFYDFYAHALDYHATTRMSDLGTANLLAYTATFGGGFSATISIEDPTARRTPSTGLPFSGSPFVYGGSNMPDIVANLRVDQGWGSAQIMGAIHEIRGGFGATAAAAPAFVPGAVGAYPDTDYGFAIGGGVKINLPFLAAGDQLWLEAGYAEGAISYTGGAPTGFNGLGVTVADAYIDTFGNTRLTKSFNVFAGLLHYWTPSLRSLFFGSYANIDAPSAVSAPLVTAGGALFASGAVRDIEELQLGASLIWTPAAAFDIGLEVLYTKVEVDGRLVSSFPEGALGISSSSEDFWQARLRFQRDF